MNLDPCPRAGSGVHRFLISEANRCRWKGLTPRTAADVLREASAACGRTVPPREIADAVRSAFASAWTPSGRASSRRFAPRFSVPLSPPKWPPPDEKRIAEIVADGFGLADLWESSPLRFDDNDNRAEQLIDCLFPGNPLLCVAEKSPADAMTAPRESFRGQLAASALIVPSPMSADTGRTKDGRESPRCLDNIGPRRFLVVEFDNGTVDNQAARLWRLAQIAPLTLAVHSGGKSIHGWFFCAGQPEAKLRSFMGYAVTLGADPATWTPCQLVRLPDGQRDNGAPQRAYYFNPGTIKL